MVAQVVLLAVLAETAGLGAAAWIVGVACAVTMAATLALGLARNPREPLGPASWLTLARATLAVGVAALVADSFTGDTPVALLVTLAAVVLALDLLDGWVARRTGTQSALGARFDGEVDAFLILALSVYVAPEFGAWVLAIGAARYLFLAADWLLPWMRAPLPPRRWRKVVAAMQGVVLAVAAADVLSRALTQALLAAALAALVASVGECVWWLWHRRHAACDQVPESDVGRPERGPLRTGIAVALTVLALLLVWAALVAPDQASRLAVADFARLPLELLIVVALAVLLPATPRRVLAVVAGMALAALMVVKVLDFGFITAFDRPFDPISDSTYVGIGIETLRDAVGRSSANLLLAGIVVLVVALLAREIPRDRFHATPGNRLLTGLRGKDVLLLFVESYGRVSVQDSSFSPGIDAALDRGTAQLRAGGFSSRSAFLTSSTFGGLSWLAHSTLQSGIRIGTQRGYNQLVKSDRLTLTQAFKRAGWRTVAEQPVNKRRWPEGRDFYHYDKVYDRRNIGYRGPGFGIAPMPDQYALEALQRQELATRDRRPVFAEVDLISSHAPWTLIPRLIPWDDLGDGSIFDRVPAEESTKAKLFGDAKRARTAYGHSIEYTMSTIVSFMRRYGDANTVVVLLGDHQPPAVTGQGATHDVPISVIARDPKAMDQIAGWGWDDGLLPNPQAPVWPMAAFRDRFLTAFGSTPATH